MSQLKNGKDYYQVLGADETTSLRDLERLYKRLASQHHPDRGGSEEKMKTLNEAYRVLKDESLRRDYDSKRRPNLEIPFVPQASPTARDVGTWGQGLSALMCLLVGLFLLFLVRFQWIFFLWPLAILASIVVVFGILLSHAALISFSLSLPYSNLLRRSWLLREALFLLAVGGGLFAIYLLFTAV